MDVTRSVTWRQTVNDLEMNRARTGDPAVVRPHCPRPVPAGGSATRLDADRRFVPSSTKVVCALSKLDKEGIRAWVRGGLAGNIRQWLNSQGYPLELRVAREFRDRGAQVVQAEYYSDPDSNVSREIDVYARYHVSDGQKNSVRQIVFATECKSSNRPWVVFTSGQAKIGSIASVVQRTTSPLDVRFLEHIARTDAVQSLPLLRAPERPAYGITEAFTTGTDVPYKAIMSAAKAARHLAVRYEVSTGAGQLKNCTVVFPVVVIGAPLFECSLDGVTNDVHVNEIQRSTLLWLNPIAGMPHTIVSVVTGRALTAFVMEVEQTARALLSRMERYALD